MSREYIVQGQNITIANAAVTLVHINPPSGRAIEIIRAWAAQAGSVTSAMAEIALGFKVTAFPTLTSVTPEKTKPSDPVSFITGGTAGAAGTSGINASAEGAGAFTPKYPDVFNILQGWLWTPSLNGGESFILSSADATAFAMKFRAAPSVLTGWSFGVLFRELG
jgi:hypothetical protein